MTNSDVLYGAKSLKEDLPVLTVPRLPDGSEATLQIVPNAFLEHNLNAHGWPLNNIQEYANRENSDVAQMFLRNLELQKGFRDGDSSLSDAQKAALCVSRTVQTPSEFVDEYIRLDSVRARFVAAKERVEPVQPVEPPKSTDEDDDDK